MFVLTQSVQLSADMLFGSRLYRSQISKHNARLNERSVGIRKWKSEKGTALDEIYQMYMHLLEEKKHI